MFKNIKKGSAKFEQLWSTNDSTGGNFSVDLDLSNYIAIVIKFNIYGSIFGTDYGYCLVGGSTNLNAYYYYNGMRGSSRNVTVTNSKITFEDGNEHRPDNTNTSNVWNCYPTEIWGIPK